MKLFELQLALGGSSGSFIPLLSALVSGINRSWFGPNCWCAVRGIWRESQINRFNYARWGKLAAFWLFSLSGKGGTLFREGQDWLAQSSPKGSFQRPGATSSSGDSPLVAWSPLPQGNHTNFKEHLLSIFAPPVSSRLFDAWNIFRPVSLLSSAVLPEQEKKAPGYITTLCSVNPPPPLPHPRLLLRLFLFHSTHICLLLFSLYCKLHWDMCALLQIHTEQSNYCDNISAWLINCSRRAFRTQLHSFYIFLSSLFLPSRAALSQELWLTHPSISLLLFHSFCLSPFLLPPSYAFILQGRWAI